ncbi:hypothetical protein Caci_2662 [Catenulispora acidiphila DSM 44928]|uniref:Uncharacterized protein n=1 Tax=Catenulispora acidiphila (strain DSM 44928 / JCM 14897 / NBRC 102108 / NRRL B-24433 / ID139908) TaxID=479433 RepID=C7PZC1_CATAD|nr:hypothetical protein [Catenulispora acidiphila]ACU71578.1 hypothetical protein Caci_2662 [Catenulispora acidiphila DSM 44928]
MTEDLPFLLREQAHDRVNEYKAEHQTDADADPPAEEDRLEPGPGQIHQERRRLQHAAEMAEEAHRRAKDNDGDDGDDRDDEAPSS